MHVLMRPPTTQLEVARGKHPTRWRRRAGIGAIASDFLSGRIQPYTSDPTPWPDEARGTPSPLTTHPERFSFDTRDGRLSPDVRLPSRTPRPTKPMTSWKASGNSSNSKSLRIRIATRSRRSSYRLGCRPHPRQPPRARGTPDPQCWPGAGCGRGRPTARLGAWKHRRRGAYAVSSSSDSAGSASSVKPICASPSGSGGG